MDTKKLRQKILDLAIHGKLVPQDPNDEPASVLLERIRAEKEKLIKEGKIKAPKKSKSAGDTSHYPKEGPWELPEGWCWTTLDRICIIKGGKRIPKGKSFSKERTQHVYIRVTDMKGMTIDMSDLKYIDNEVYNEISRYIIKKDDLYLTIAGTIGKVGEIPDALDGMNLTENAARLTDIVCDKLYLMFALQSGVAQNHFSTRFHQVAQPKLSIETASSTPIALPPLSEQKRIVSAIREILLPLDSVEAEQLEMEATIEKAKGRILDLAIHGKLVPQDPSDEPAIDLLKRINPGFKPSDNLHYKDGVGKGWRRCRICDAFEINPKVLGNNDDECAFIPMALVPGGYSNELKFEIKRWETIKNGFSRFSDGDIGVAKISPCLENRKSVVFRGLPSGRGAGTTELIVFRPVLVTSEYGLLFFKSQEFIANCKGTYSGVVGQQRVDMSAIKGMYINIPPISEQHKIVKTVELLFSYLDIIQRCNEF